MVTAVNISSVILYSHFLFVCFTSHRVMVMKGFVKDIELDNFYTHFQDLAPSGLFLHEFHIKLNTSYSLPAFSTLTVWITLTQTYFAFLSSWKYLSGLPN